MGDKDIAAVPPTACEDDTVTASETETAVNQPDHSSQHDGTVEEDIFPGDTGNLHAYLTVFASFLCCFSAYGYLNCWGIFQDYYTYHTFAGRASVTAVTVIGSIGNGGEAAFGLLAGPLLNRFGLRFILWLGSACVTLGILLASWGTEIWQLCLSQGVLFAFGAALLYMAGSTVIPQWFLKRRSLMMGIAVSGSGVGGLVLSPVVQTVQDRVGVAWALRVVALVELVASVTAALLIRPPKKRRSSHQGTADNGEKAKKSRKKILDFQVLKRPGFPFWFLAATMFTFGYATPFSFVPSYAQMYGMSPSQGAACIAVMSGLTAVGRIIIGFCADRFGKVQIGIVSYFIAGIANFFIWQFATKFATLMGFSALFGLFSGVYFALSVPITVEVTGISSLSSALSFIFFANAISAVSAIPICGAIFEATHRTSYTGVIMFTGASYVIGAFCLVALEIILVRERHRSHTT